MEIPFVVKPRKDTGLTNSKIGIWLFLASEVMLFGGLFSAYIFLRIYADYPWPERVLPIVPGLINTFILILSSVTVVFAWAMLKLRNFMAFRLFMFITLACAALFMGLKFIEYKKKLTHQAVRLPDYTIVEGHVHKAKVDQKGHIIHDSHGSGSHDSHGSDSHDSHGKKEHGGQKGKEYTQKTSVYQLIFETDSITFDLTKFHTPSVKDIFKQAKDLGAELIFEEEFSFYEVPSKKKVVVARAGQSDAGSPESVLKAFEAGKKLFVAARTYNAKLKTNDLRKQWKEAPKDIPNWKHAPNVKLDEALNDLMAPLNNTVTLKVNPPVALLLNPRKTSVTDTTATYLDSTIFQGKLLDSPMELAIDAVDFTFLVQQAEFVGIDPDEAIENSWILANNPQIKSYWEKHKDHIKNLEARLLEEAGGDKDKAKEPTEVERYKMTWKDMVRYGSKGEIDLGWANGFAGANHKNKNWSQHFPELSLPREQIAFESKFSPRWNNFYAIYFTITGLHGLHIIGGSIVLGYYMFCSKMFRENPEWLANRVEIAGLFWHFVDLVWIFLFPILYLM